MRLLPALLLATCLVLCNAARADVVTVQFDYPVWTPLGYDYINFSVDGGAHYVAAAATRFQGTVLSMSGSLNGLSFVNSTDDLYLYCYDLLQYINHGGTYVYTVDYSGVQSRTLDWLGSVDYVLNGGTNTWADPYAWLHPAAITINSVNVTATEVAAAIQLGIWESLYDSGSVFALDGGTFRASDLDTGTALAWNAFDAARSNAADAAPSTTLLLSSATAQDQITGLRPPIDRQQTVPEPGTLLLATLALGMASISLRRARS